MDVLRILFLLFLCHAAGCGSGMNESRYVELAAQTALIEEAHKGNPTLIEYYKKQLKEDMGVSEDMVRAFEERMGRDGELRLRVHEAVGDYIEKLADR